MNPIGDDNSFSWTNVQVLIDKVKDLFMHSGSNNLLEQVILPIAAIIVFGMIIWGGVKYIQNDPEAGKKTITAALIGLVIVAFASLIVTQVINIIEGNLDAPAEEEEEEPEGETE